MTARDKILARMRNNPRGWHVDDLKALAKHFGIAFRQKGTSHVTFVIPGKRSLPVPANNPVEPEYVRAFLKLIDEVI